MPRRAREKSATGIYHIMFRGANRQEIFHDEEDKLRFLEILEKYKKNSKVEVYAWCLMDNHIHILLKEGAEEISQTLKRVAVSYVWFYNSKYKATGHLFQDRFKSEKVESDGYLMTVVRYIHQNPVVIGLCKKCDEWKWSSCASYYGKSKYPEELLDKNFVLSIFHEDITKGKKFFKEFNEIISDDKCLDDEQNKKLNESEARLEIIKIVKNPANIKSLPKRERDRIISEIKKIEGISKRQISRVLGISMGVITKA